MRPSADGPLAAEVVRQIRTIRGQRVLLDADLAILYGVSTKVFNQAVRRNLDRFPQDFLLRLTNQDVAALRSQIVTLKTGRGTHRKYPMLAFSEHGAIMAATILNSARAVEMSVYVVRAFIKMREMLASNSELARELGALKKSVATLDADTRRQFDVVYEAILGLMSPTAKKQ
jgi:phage regulator Rha-like protein